MNTKTTSKRQTKKKSGNMSPLARLPKELASKVLSNVPREQGFYFYWSIGNPTGEVACSFDEFCQRIKSSDPASLEFHLTRGDFESWIRFLGDLELANQIERLRAVSLTREQMTQSFVFTIEKRRELLRKSA